MKECKYKKDLSESRMCYRTCYYCTFEQELVCKEKEYDEEKQIVKPKNVFDDGIERYLCNCGNIMHRKQNFCYNCGQKLRLEDEE